MAITVDALTEKSIEELAKSLGRSKLSVLKAAVRHYADECRGPDEAMSRPPDPHARLIDHEEAKRALNLVNQGGQQSSKGSGQGAGDCFEWSDIKHDRESLQEVTLEEDGTRLVVPLFLIVFGWPYDRLRLFSVISPFPLD